MATRNYQSYMGPTDPNLRHSEIEGYQPVSRIGEVVINSFIDSYEFTALPEAVNVEDVEPTPDGNRRSVDPRDRRSWASPLSTSRTSTSGRRRCRA